MGEQASLRNAVCAVWRVSVVLVMLRISNSLDSENLASLWVTPSAHAGEHIYIERECVCVCVIRTSLSFTRGGTTAKVPVNQLDISELTIPQSALDCFVNELFCLF